VEVQANVMNTVAATSEKNIAIFDLMMSSWDKVTASLLSHRHSNQNYVLFDGTISWSACCPHLKVVLRRFFNFHTFIKTNFL